MEKSGNGAMFSSTDKNPASAGKEFAAFLEGNGVILFVPGRANTRPATPIHAPSGHLKILTAFGLPLLPVAIDCPRESCLGIERISSLPAAVIAFGKPIPAKESSLPALQANLLEAFAEAYDTREILKGSLATALLHGLKNNPGDRLTDGSDDVVLPFSKILPVALAL
jgi:1-acyl-sn-glycerol-3-phosphate acyltransferase